jgi:hypothetical protein
LLFVLYYNIVRSRQAGGFAAGIGGFATAWGFAWAGSQVTKPLRLLVSLGMAPYIDAKLRKIKRH